MAKVYETRYMFKRTQSLSNASLRSRLTSTNNTQQTVAPSSETR